MGPEAAYTLRHLLRSVLFCCLACVLVALAAALDVAQARLLLDVNRHIRHWRDIEITSERVLGALRDAETGQRGYLLTQHDEYLAPFDQGSAVVSGLLDQLQRLTAQDPDWSARVHQLDDLARRKLDELRTTIELNRSGNTAAALALVTSGQGRQLMSDTHGVIDEIEAMASSAIAQSRARADAATQRLILSVVMTTNLSIALLIALTYLMRRDARHIRESAEQLSITLRSIGDAVVTTDAAGYVTFMNQVALDIGKRPPPREPALFKDMFRLVNELNAEPAEDPVAQVLRDGRTIALANHTALVRPDGTQVSIEDSAAPLRDERGHIRGVVFVFKDITDRRQAENELALARAKLEATIAELRASEAQLRVFDRRKDEFLATLSHELRNPIAPIRQAIQILDSTNLTDEQHGWARDVIRRQVKHVSRLLDDLLDSTRITRGELNLKVAPVPLKSVVTEALDIAMPMIQRKAHSLQVALPDHPLMLQVDGVRLSQALSNILVNAAKYTDNGGRITLSADQTAEELSIAVRDSGVGLSAEAIPLVFEMFAQIPSSRNRSEDGLGIGLSLSAALIRLHGGSIEARSDGHGKGSEFVIRLPASVIAKLDPILPLQPQQPESKNPSRLILVVDDNQDAAESLAMLLQAAGHETLIAHSGEDGLKLARARPPSVAVIDIGLPGIQGYDVARALRAMPTGRDMLLVALTGWGQEDDKERAAAAGFDHHLTKPADTAELDAIIASHCAPVMSMPATDRA